MSLNLLSTGVGQGEPGHVRPPPHFLAAQNVIILLLLKFCG